MAEIIWFELYPPRDLDPAAVTDFIRPIANRPRRGLLRQTPVVVFELWADGASMYWLLGMDWWLSTYLPHQLRAQLPALGLVRRTQPLRPTPRFASKVQVTGFVERLRLDMAASVSTGLLEMLGALNNGESAVVQWVIGAAQSRQAPPAAFSLLRSLGFGAAVTPSAQEKRFWRAKVTEPLFAVRGRLGAHGALPERTSAIIRVLADALSLANASHTQLRITKPAKRHTRDVSTVYAPGRSWSGVLNGAELAALLGWPLDGVTSLAGVSRHVSRVPAALLLSAERAEQQPRGRVLGESLHPADGGQLVTMPVRTCLHHVHVIGPTGSGKSNLLADLVQADMAAGYGVLVIEPKGDLVTDILAGVPEGRRDDVVVIEPGDGHQIVGINPLAGPRADAELRADQLLHLFHEVFGSNLGPRSSDVLLHSLIALGRSPQGTLADVPVLLTNAVFRRNLLGQVTDPLVLAPFFAWYDGLSDAERGQVIAPVLNKTRAFLSRSVIRRLLGQAVPRFQLDELFTHRRIVLVNLNAGVIGAETAALIGALLVTQLWQAIQRRAAVPANQRRPVMVVIDEVQNYLKLPVDLGDMLAQARGHGVSLTLAHQALSQLPTNLRAAVMANARSRIVFRPASDDAKPLAAELGGGLVADDLACLGAFEACVRLLMDHTMTEPFSVRTRRLGPALVDPADLRQASRERYGVDGDELDAELVKRWHDERGTPEGPIGVIRRRPA